MKPNPLLVLYAHAAPHRLRVNRRLADCARQVDGVCLHDLYETYRRTRNWLRRPDEPSACIARDTGRRRRLTGRGTRTVSATLAKRFRRSQHPQNRARPHVARVMPPRRLNPCASAHQKGLDTGLRPGPFPTRVASLLPGLLTATRTGLTPASDDEHEQQITPSRGHLPFHWAHERSRLRPRLSRGISHAPPASTGHPNDPRHNAGLGIIAAKPNSA